MADTKLKTTVTTLAPIRDASHLSLATLKTLTRGSLPGEEFRLLRTYGCSVIGARIWLRYARHFGLRCPPVATALDYAEVEGRKDFDNLHGQRILVRELTYGQRLVREAQAREERGENFKLLRRQAG